MLPDGRPTHVLSISSRHIKELPYVITGICEQAVLYNIIKVQGLLYSLNIKWMVFLLYHLLKIYETKQIFYHTSNIVISASTNILGIFLVSLLIQYCNKKAYRERRSAMQLVLISILGGDW